MATIRPEVRGRSSSGPNWIELQRIVSLSEAAQLSGISIDTIKRRHAEKIIQLSPRRLGMRVREALMLSEENHLI
jgi:predicted HTH domain antitoxin